MKPALASLVVLAIALSSCSDSALGIAPSGRIMTIEQWRSPEGTAWAVLDDRLVVYRMFDYVGRGDELVVEKSLTPIQSRAIRDAISALPREVMGLRHDGSLSSHAPLLRIGFSRDGSFDEQGIEVAGFHPVWLDPLLESMSSVTSPDAPVTFVEVADEYRLRVLQGERDSIEVRTYALREYHQLPNWWEFWK